jgi:hypothetical protein
MDVDAARGPPRRVHRDRAAECLAVEAAFWVWFQAEPRHDVVPGGARGAGPPSVDGHEDVADRSGLVGVVGDEDGARAVAGEGVAQADAEGRPGGRVQGDERLVEQEQARRHRQRAGERHPLPLPAGQAVGPRGSRGG